MDTNSKAVVASKPRGPYPAFAGGDRENVAGLDDVVDGGVLGDGDLNGAGAVSGGNAGGDAFDGFDGNGEGGTVLGLVVLGHLGEAELLAAGFSQRKADQATAEFGHEIDRFGRDVFGGHDEVALVFAVFFIDQDDHATGLEFGDDLSGGGNGGMGRHGGNPDNGKGGNFRRSSAQRTA